MEAKSQSGVKQKEKKSELEAFKLSPELRARFEDDVKKSGLTKSQWIRQSIENYLTRDAESVHVVVGIEHGQKVQAPLSAVVKEYVKSARIILEDNREFIKGVLYVFFESWREMRRAENRKRGKKSRGVIKRKGIKP